MRNQSARWLAVTLAFLGICSVGCGDLMHMGEPEPQPEPVAPTIRLSMGSETRPVAVGASKRIHLYVTPTNAEIESLTIRAEGDAFGVEVRDDDGVLLRARAAGRDTIEAVASFADHPDARATVDVQARQPARVELHHRCSTHLRNLMHPSYSAGDEFERQPYLVGTQARISMEVFDADGWRLDTHDFLPVQWEPSGALELVDRNRDELNFEAGSQPGEVTLTSTVDQTELPMQWVEVGDVDALTALEEGLAEEVEMEALSFDVSVHLAGVVDGKAICEAGVGASMQSLTPQVCEVRAVTDYSEAAALDLVALYSGVDLVWSSGYHELEVLEAGRCELQGHAPDAAGGQGASWDYAIEVAPAQ